jgi:hypothetical protein
LSKLRADSEPGPLSGSQGGGMATARLVICCVVALGSIGSTVAFAPLKSLNNYPSFKAIESVKGLTSFVRDAPHHVSFAPNLRNKATPRHLTIDTAELNQRIAKFYDDRLFFSLSLAVPTIFFILMHMQFYTFLFWCACSSTLWEEVWGEHMHMGHYGEAGNEKKTDSAAQIDMVDRLLDWGIGSDKPPADVLDVGCGVGGSSRHIARRFGSKVTGITLSFLQCEHAQQRSEKEGLSASTRFLVADALSLPFEDNSFDLVWSLESGNPTIWMITSP